MTSATTNPPVQWTALVGTRALIVPAPTSEQAHAIAKSQAEQQMRRVRVYDEDIVVRPTTEADLEAFREDGHTVMFDRPLTASEFEDLSALEGTVREGLKAEMNGARALREIRDRRLYRATHATFAAYCEEQIGMSRTHADRLCKAASVADAITPVGVKNESQARALGRLASQPDDMRRVAAEIAVDGHLPVTRVVHERVEEELQAAREVRVKPRTPSPDEERCRQITRLAREMEHDRAHMDPTAGQAFDEAWAAMDDIRSPAKPRLDGARPVRGRRS